MSNNVIKAYSISYDTERIAKLDMADREQSIADRIHELIPEQRFLKFREKPGVTDKGAGGGFVAGLIAEDISGQLEEGSLREGSLREGSLREGASLEEQELSGQPFSEQTVERIKESLREELRAELAAEAEAENAARTEEVLAAARAEAEGLIAAAKNEAEMAKAGILKMASEQGYEEGTKRAKQEEERALAALEEEKLQLQKEYERRVSELEPAFVQILIAMVKKLTGVSYENHAEVILHLIDDGINSSKRDKKFTVRLCPKDYDTISDYLPRFFARYEGRMELTAEPDETLEPGDCCLENDNKVIHCGLGTKQKGLLDALSMLTPD